MTVFGPATLDEGHGSAWLRIVYTAPDQRSDLELEKLAANGIDAHNTRFDLNAAVGGAFGVTHRLTLSFELPYVRRESIRAAQAGGAVERLGSIGGVGDINLLAKYRLGSGESGGVAVLAGIKVPSGSTHERDRLGNTVETEHQPGTGSWDPIAGASVGARLGVLNLAASAIYQFSGAGAQQTRLGDRLQGGVAVSHHFGPGEEDEHGEELRAQPHRHPSSWDAFVEVAGEWEGRERTGDEVDRYSGGKWAWVAPGLTFNAVSGWSASAAFAVGLFERIRASHPANRYRLLLSLAHHL